MKKSTPQLEQWKSIFGKEYTNRCNVSISKAEETSRQQIGRTISDSFRVFVTGLDITRVLEVGCNVGQKLEILSSLGNYRLYGVEPQIYALKKARRRLLEINFVEGNAFDIPFKDSFFDMVFTAGVLIHISPGELHIALDEIYRVSRQYILGFEYYSEQVEEVEYRGHKSLLWKMDYEQAYRQRFPKLRTIKSEILEYDESAYGRRGLFEKHFLLSK